MTDLGLNNQSKNTADIIKIAGASQGSSGNLRRGAEVLGNADYINTLQFYNIINKWRNDIFIAYKDEFKRQHLI